MMVNVLVLWNWWCCQCLHACSPVVSHLKLLSTFTTIKALKEKRITPTRGTWVTARGCACVCVGGGERESEWEGYQRHCSSSSCTTSRKAWSECYSGVSFCCFCLLSIPGWEMQIWPVQSQGYGGEILQHHHGVQSLRYATEQRLFSYLMLIRKLWILWDRT